MNYAQLTRVGCRIMILNVTALKKYIYKRERKTTDTTEYIGYEEDIRVFRLFKKFSNPFEYWTKQEGTRRKGEARNKLVGVVYVFVYIYNIMNIIYIIG